jgi:hypothetical protein
MAHNGGRSQENFNFLQVGGDYAFLNALKQGQNWTLVDNSAQPSPSSLDSNGYPTTISNGGVYTVFYIPTQTDRPGNWVIKWTGGGTVRANFSHTAVSGSLSGTDGRYEFTPTGTPDATFDALRIDMGITAITSGITSLTFCHVDDEPLLTAGNVFGTKFKQRLAEGNFGVLRYLNWLQANKSMATTWATRKPTGYVFYLGDEFRSSIDGGTTTNVGDDYAATVSGFALADKATVLVKFNANATGTTPTLNVSSTGAKTIKNQCGDALTVGGNDKPLNGVWAVCVYDSDLGCWLKQGGDLAAGNVLLNNGCPPELMVQLANEMGAHPWLHVPYPRARPENRLRDAARHLCARSISGVDLIPRFEPANEVWNSTSSPSGRRATAGTRRMRTGAQARTRTTGTARCFPPLGRT